MNYLIYPFSASLIPFADCIMEFRTDLKIKKYVCPKSWEFSFREEQIIQDNPIQIETEFSTALDSVDGVILCDCKNLPWLYKDIVKKIKIAVGRGKKVICCTPVKDQDLDSIKKIKEYDESKFLYFADYPDLKSLEFSRFQTQDCIIVGVGSLLRGVDDSDSFYYMIQKYRELGYTVVGIGTDFHDALIGGYIFPENIFSSPRSEEDKILDLNAYINLIQRETSADVMIVKFPDGMMKYSDELCEGYGIKAFMTSQALSVDYFVLNVPMMEIFDQESFESLNIGFKYRFGFEIDAIGVNGKEIDLSNSLEMDKLCYKNLEWKYVLEYVQIANRECSGILFFPTKLQNEYDRIVSDSIEKLSGNVEEF